MALGDVLRKVFGLSPKPQVVARRFDDNPVYPVDQLLLYMQSKLGNIGRDDALSVPAMLRGRNLICSISTLPLEAVDRQHHVLDSPLLDQIDPNVPNVVTLAMTIEDLLFDAVAWWRVIDFENGYPAKAVRYAPDQVSMRPPKDYRRGYLPSGLPTEPAADLGDGKVVWMGGEPVPYSRVIRFDSPNPGLLVAACRTLKRAIAIDEAAQLFAENPRMRGYFSPKDPNVDPGDDAAITAALDAWALARQERVDGYVPAALDYNTVTDMNPADLQLVQLSEKVTKDLANALGLDPEDLAVSTTSRTYQNATDRRKDRINDTLSPYMAAVTSRLSMPDVTPPGERARWNLDDYLRADPKTRAEVQQIYNAMGATDAAEIRDDEGRPPRVIAPPVRPAAPELAVA